MRDRGRRLVPALVVLGALAGPVLPPALVRAGGYDTPMLYSARHMGMGGTAIGFVEDPSALFHNPAGLGQVRRFSVLGDFSLLLGGLRASPDTTPGTPRDIESEPTVAPMFLLGGAYRLTDWLVAGLGVYPIASAGATYEYDGIVGRTEDRTRLVFIEASPGLAVNLPGRVRLGVGYRITYVNLQRFKGWKPEDRRGFDFDLSGFNWLGFRVGAQWQPVEGLQVGAVYRHKVTTTVKNDSGWAAAQYVDVSTEFLLPSKMGAGARYDLGDLGLALDLEYLFNGQNEGSPLSGTTVANEFSPAMPAEVPNVFRWKNALTVRTGVEYRLLPPEPQAQSQEQSQAQSRAKGRLALRLGYVFDAETTNPDFPSAFGTPPGPTHIVTAGAGWNVGTWQVNVAYARRAGSGRANDPEPGACAFCGAAGNEPYKLTIHGLYVDASLAFD
jgi:long-subunit fatty acid transport protein